MKIYFAFKINSLALDKNQKKPFKIKGFLGLFLLLKA
tara:strand:- start:34 stop:144 length:111 start_codon:yes stop_codon:yes gene_type:complete